MRHGERLLLLPRPLRHGLARVDVSGRGSRSDAAARERKEDDVSLFSAVLGRLPARKTQEESEREAYADVVVVAVDVNDRLLFLRKPPARNLPMAKKVSRADSSGWLPPFSLSRERFYRTTTFRR